jgi:hypothetical protein
MALTWYEAQKNHYSRTNPPEKADNLIEPRKIFSNLLPND